MGAGGGGELKCKMYLTELKPRRRSKWYGLFSMCGKENDGAGPPAIDGCKGAGGEVKM